jgi:hypothetical protein
VVLHLDELAEIIDAAAPCKAVDDKQKVGVTAFLSVDFFDIAEDVSLFADGGAVAFDDDRDGRVFLTLMGMAESTSRYCGQPRRYSYLWMCFTSYNRRSRSWRV